MSSYIGYRRRREITISTDDFFRDSGYTTVNGLTDAIKYKLYSPRLSARERVEIISNKVNVQL